MAYVRHPDAHKQRHAQDDDKNADHRLSGLCRNAVPLHVVLTDDGSDEDPVAHVGSTYNGGYPVLETHYNEVGGPDSTEEVNNQH